MAIAFNASADGGQVTSATSLTFSYTVGGGSNRKLFVTATGATTDNLTGATYNGVAMSLLAKMFGGSGRWEYLFELNNPASGANNVVITASGTSDFILGGASDYSGCAQAASEVIVTNTSSPTSVASLTTAITTISDNDWVVLTASGFSGSAPPTAGTGSTFRSADGVFGIWGLFDSGAPVTPAGSYSMTVNYNAAGLNKISVIMAAFAPAGVSTFDMTSRRAINIQQQPDTPSHTFTRSGITPGGIIIPNIGSVFILP